jgi:hypothetical protein
VNSTVRPLIRTCFSYEPEIPELRFTILTLLLFTSTIAIAIAMVCRPSLVGVQLLRSTVILTGCASLAIGFLTSGRTRAFTLTFGIFSIASLSLNACPTVLSGWIAENAPRPVLESDPFGNQASSQVIHITRYWFAVFVALLAGSVAARLHASERRLG